MFDQLIELGLRVKGIRFNSGQGQAYKRCSVDLRDYSVYSYIYIYQFTGNLFIIGYDIYFFRSSHS